VYKIFLATYKYSILIYSPQNIKNIFTTVLGRKINNDNEYPSLKLFAV
jgi:hypothetical protein